MNIRTTILLTGAVLMSAMTVAEVYADEKSTPEILLEQDAATYLRTLVDSRASPADVDVAWNRWRASSAMAVFNGVERTRENPECWAPALIGKRNGRSGREVFVRDCLGLDPIAVLTSGRYVR